jgi:hypothetical protein
MTRAYLASFKDQNLRAWETPDGYLWKVTSAVTGDTIAQGEATSREDAMIDAAQAAGADWGSARWRSLSEDNED